MNLFKIVYKMKKIYLFFSLFSPGNNKVQKSLKCLSPLFTQNKFSKSEFYAFLITFFNITHPKNSKSVFYAISTHFA